MKRARALRIGNLVRSTPEHLSALTKAEAYYAPPCKGFEYFEITKAAIAYPDLPDLDALAELASELVKQLKQFALDAA